MSRSMCIWCGRAPYAPHLANCPELTGIAPQRNWTPHRTLKRTGAYLRRGRDEKRVLPSTMYLVETEHAPDSPAILYAEDTRA